MDVKASDILRRLAMFLAAAAVVGSALAARGDSIRLHDQAAVRGGAVTLADVATLDGPRAQRLGDTPVVTLPEEQAATTVTLEAVRRRLDQHGVNWADLSLRGYAACRVVRLTPIPSPAADPSGAVASNPREEVNLASTMTLRDLLTRCAEDVAGAPRDELRITFAERDADALARPVFGQRYEVVPHKERGLGRLLLKVHRYEMDRVVERSTFAVDVARRTLAAVATRNIGRGETLRAGSFEIREVFLDDASIDPIADPRLLVGQAAGRLMREGRIITPEDLRSPVMVRRGELVAVRCVSGNLVIRTDARALADGALDETIRLRNERSREEFGATVTGLREVSFTITPTPLDTRQAAAP